MALFSESGLATFSSGRAAPDRSSRRHLDTEGGQLRPVDLAGNTHTVLFAVDAGLAEACSGGYRLRRDYRSRVPSGWACDPETPLQPVRKTACDRIRFGQRRSRRFDSGQDGHAALLKMEPSSLMAPPKTMDPFP